MNFWSRGRAVIAKALGLDLVHPQRHYAEALSALLSPGDKWLDMGCGRQIFPPWGMAMEEQAALAARASLFVGMDVDSAILEHPLLHDRVIGFGERMPFADATFDLITANMVFEHIQDPPRVLREIFRILKDDGRLLFHTPNYHSYLVFIASVVPDSIKKRVIWVLERRREEDVFPAFYRINTMKSIRKLSGACGFEVEAIRASISPGDFHALGPIGWLECFILKFFHTVGAGRFDACLIATLRRPSARIKEVPAPGRTGTP